jgi:cyclohexyl-isocyanide hydratase
MSLTIGMLLYPGLTQLDLTGPYEVFTRIPGASVHVLWKTLEPVRSDAGLGLLPSTTLAECPALDVVFVPGGSGQIAMMEDDTVLTFLAAQGARARWVTSVCTGALLLGAAGLLRDYRATTHWGFLPLLSLVGAEPVSERVVIDRNRITAGGVTSGIDFALTIARELAGPEVARGIELMLEYDPAPPSGCGHPRSAPPELVARVRQGFARRFELRKEQLERMTAGQR